MPYRILVLIREMIQRGAEKHVVDLSRKLKESGHTVVVASGGGPLVKELEGGNIRHYQISLENRYRGFPRVGNAWKAAIAIANIVKVEGINIIHSHALFPLCCAALGARIGKGRKGVKFFSTIHMLFSQKMGGYWMGSLILRMLSDYTIFVSQYEQSRFTRTKILNASQTCVIHNAIDVAEFQGNDGDSFRRELGLCEGPPLVGVIGQINEQKGHRYLIEAFCKVVKVMPNALLIIVGDGDLNLAIRRLVRQAGLWESVIFTGSRQDIPSLLESLDVFVLPSLWESFPIAILEAMAAKVPVVATDVGGVSEVVWNGQTGVLVKARNADALSEAILDLLINVDLRERLAKRAYEVVKERFALGKMVAEVERVYDKVWKEGERSCDH